MSCFDEIERPPYEQQEQRTLNCMQGDLPVCGSLFFPVGYSKWNCHSYNEHEERLYQIPEMKSMPFMVFKLSAYKMHYSAVIIKQCSIQVRCFPCQHKHGKSPEEVTGCYSSG